MNNLIKASTAQLLLWVTRTYMLKELIDKLLLLEVNELEYQVLLEVQQTSEAQPYQQYQITEFLQQQYQRLEEHALRIASWETNILTNLYTKPPTFNPFIQARFDEYLPQILIPNVRDRLVTCQNLENYNKEQTNTTTNNKFRDKSFTSAKKTRI